ncbi:MAG: hypothetical protein ABI572_07640 [Actinomycetota bacterium]
MRRVSVLFAVLIALLPALVGRSPASAYDITDSPEIQAMEGRISDAMAEVDRWNHRLATWQSEIVKASAVVQRLTYVADSDEHGTGSLDVLSRGLRRTDVLEYRLALAHEDLRRVLHDPEARNGQQQVEAWTAYVNELIAARDTMIRKAKRGFSFAPGEPVTYEAWASGFLNRLGAPRCDENLLIVVAWETSESTAAAFNPLATTHAMEGATDMNSVGVKNYVSLDQGLDASRDTLTGGAESYGYGSIVDSLRACAPAEATAAAINASAWCRGCTDGMYLTGLLPLVRDAYADHAARLISTTPS